MILAKSDPNQQMHSNDTNKKIDIEHRFLFYNRGFYYGNYFF